MQVSGVTRATSYKKLYILLLKYIVDCVHIAIAINMHIYLSYYYVQLNTGGYTQKAEPVRGKVNKDKCWSLAGLSGSSYGHVACSVDICR